MSFSVKEDYKKEVLELACKHNRFNLKGFVYAPEKSKDDVVEHFDSFKNRFCSSPSLQLSLINLLKVSKVMEVYKFNKQNIDDLEKIDGVEKKIDKYIIHTESLDDEVLYNLFQNVNEDEPKRGSIFFGSIINMELKEFIKNCYDPSFLINLKYKNSESALKKATKKILIECMWC